MAADGVAARSSAQPYPLLQAAARRARQRTRFSAGTPELQPLTGKGGKVSGRRSAQAAPRRSRATAQREGSGRRRGPLQRPTLPKPYPLLVVPANEPDSRPERQPLTGKCGKVSGRGSAQAAPRRSRAPGATGRQRSTSQRPLQRPPHFPNPPPASPPQSEDLVACPPARAGRSVSFEERGKSFFRRASGAPPRLSVPFGRPFDLPFFQLTGRARRAADAPHEGLAPPPSRRVSVETRFQSHAQPCRLGSGKPVAVFAVAGFRPQNLRCASTRVRSCTTHCTAPALHCSLQFAHPACP